MRLRVHSNQHLLLVNKIVEIVVELRQMLLLVFYPFHVLSGFRKLVRESLTFLDHCHR